MLQTFHRVATPRLIEDSSGQTFLIAALWTMTGVYVMTFVLRMCMSRPKEKTTEEQAQKDGTSGMVFMIRPLNKNGDEVYDRPTGP